MSKDFNIIEFSKKNSTRSILEFKMQPGPQNIPYLIIALTGELGEFANAYKKLIRQKDPGTGRDWQKITHHDMAMELADMMIYLDLMAKSMGVELSEVVKEKFNMVSDNLKCNIKIE